MTGAKIIEKHQWAEDRARMQSVTLFVDSHVEKQALPAKAGAQHTRPPVLPPPRVRRGSRATMLEGGLEILARNNNQKWDGRPYLKVWTLTEREISCPRVLQVWRHASP